MVALHIQCSGALVEQSLCYKSDLATIRLTNFIYSPVFQRNIGYISRMFSCDSVVVVSNMRCWMWVCTCCVENWPVSSLKNITCTSIFYGYIIAHKPCSQPYLMLMKVALSFIFCKVFIGLPFSNLILVLYSSDHRFFFRFESTLFLLYLYHYISLFWIVVTVDYFIVVQPACFFIASLGFCVCTHFNSHYPMLKTWVISVC